jgi:hypothetical protein
VRDNTVKSKYGTIAVLFLGLTENNTVRGKYYKLENVLSHYELRKIYST